MKTEWCMYAMYAFFNSIRSANEPLIIISVGYHLHMIANCSRITCINSVTNRKTRTNNNFVMNQFAHISNWISRNDIHDKIFCLFLLAFFFDVVDVVFVICLLYAHTNYATSFFCLLRSCISHAANVN